MRSRVRGNGTMRARECSYDKKRRVRACPRLAPGSGFGSVADETTVCNGVEPRRKQPRRVSPLRAGIPHAGLALASANPRVGKPSPRIGGGWRL